MWQKSCGIAVSIVQEPETSFKEDVAATIISASSLCKVDRAFLSLIAMGAP